MKNRILFITAFLISFSAFSQIGGLSNSKLASLNIESVAKHHIEFEPTVSHVTATKYWDDNAQLQSLYSTSDSVLKNTSMVFRFTYGLIENMEIGGSISTSLGLMNLGVKYKFWNNEQMGIAAIAGANIPLGNKTVDKNIRFSDQLSHFGGGLIYSAYFNEKLSLDASAQYLFFAETTDDKNKGSYYLNTDVGYFVFKQTLQLCLGVGYASSRFENFDSNVVSIYPGVTVHTGEKFVMILQAPFDIAGKNNQKNAGFAFSLTMTID